MPVMGYPTSNLPGYPPEARTTQREGSGLRARERWGPFSRRSEGGEGFNKIAVQAMHQGLGFRDPLCWTREPEQARPFGGHHETRVGGIR